MRTISYRKLVKLLRSNRTGIKIESFLAQIHQDSRISTITIRLPSAVFVALCTFPYSTVSERPPCCS